RGGASSKPDDAGGDRQCRPLLVGEAGVGEPVGVGVDEVALLQAPAVSVGELYGDADPAQQLLVALEHAVERLVARPAVAGDLVAYLVGGHRPACGEQKGEEVQEPLDDPAHRAHSTRRPPTSERLPAAACRLPTLRATR